MYRHVLEKQLTPVILHVEEKAKHKDYVHQADEDDHHHATVHLHPVCLLSLHAPSPNQHYRLTVAASPPSNNRWVVYTLHTQYNIILREGVSFENCQNPT